MSENKLIEAVRGLSDEQLAEIAGGNCTINDIQVAIDNAKESYDKLVDFASYVIERVAN